jgi:NAD-dependent dihydropyrimidine dehydrogenase PreA subunit
MSRYRLPVVLSQAPGKHPAKRALEESLVAALLFENGIDASIIPNLYDLDPTHTGRMFLESIHGDAIILSWLYPRAAFWLLDRIGIQGHFGESQLKPPRDEDEDEEGNEEQAPSKGVGPTGELPDRHLYCLDLRDFNQAEPYLKEIRRIYEECRTRSEQKEASKAAKPAMVELGLPTKPGPAVSAFAPEQLLAPPNRRWYPVIDYSRCTNCMECLDFCLFGVYGVDKSDKLLVENQDNCKKGCPACSRVCPEQAIMFPEYKSPAIAGAPNTGAIGGLKIDLTKLFGGDAKDAVSQAVAERDRELVADGRQAVGAAVGLSKRQPHHEQEPKDDLDKLMDDLDSLGL